jgi:predicted Zn-ribbon and HTH transcriptional regulator
MAQPTCSEKDFIELFQHHRSPSKVAQILKLNERSVHSRKRAIENRLGITLESNDPQGRAKFTIPENKMRCEYELKDGIIMVGSDCHYNPEYTTTAHKAFVYFMKQLKPNMCVLNGDLFDFAQISAHHRIGWQKHPTVQQELEEVQNRLGDIEKVRPAGCILHRTIGNHDLRFEGKLSNLVGQYEGVKGMCLDDHLPHWSSSWSVVVNGNTMIKHRWHNGIHAVYNNILKGGMSMVTGHLHSLKVTPWTNYRGDLYGVDTGMMAAVKDDQFLYHEDASVNWRAGWAVLTYINGHLMPPELCQVINEDESLVFFRGELHEINA